MSSKISRGCGRAWNFSNKMIHIDLNADLGEGGSCDEQILQLINSANIACGGHAGSDEIMRRTIELALAAGVAIGAHPGYKDRENFGRSELQVSPEEITALVARQVGKLAGFAGGHLHHVKPHGALYNQADRDPHLAAAVVRGICEVSPNLILYAPPHGSLAAAGRAAGLVVRREGFVDRRYREDGSLAPRGEEGAVITDIHAAVAQAEALAQGGRYDTLCVHGDGARAVEMLLAVREKFGLR